MSNIEKHKDSKPRCEGWRRYGGALSFGPPKWEQCKETGIVMLTVKQDGKTEALPACAICWKEVIQNKIEILESKPL